MMVINTQYRQGMRRLLIGVLAMTATPQIHAASAEEILKNDCAGCHNLIGPAPTTLQALWNRKGPDLFYAGNKYQARWLEKWLQTPTRIRPAGMFYANHVKPGAKGDEIDTASLADHPALAMNDAKAITAALMKLTTRSELIRPGEYKPGTVSLATGEMLFDKFRGCLSCHEIEPGYGGMSGSEVYTAAARLQPDYLISYMRNPQAWDPKVFMPNKHLSDVDLQKLVHYLRAIDEENGK